jgi:signal transduction histidine kinase
MPLRVRTLILWLVFLAAAGIGGIAVHRLYVRTQTELRAQSDRAVAQARAGATQRIDAYLAATRRALLVELAGFHDDGLRNTLQRWDAANHLVDDTIVWDPSQAAPPAKFSVLADTIREFRPWRSAHPEAVVRLRDEAGSEVLGFRTLDNPAIAAEGLRYQQENLDLLRDAGRSVDPWAGWTPAAEGCVLWYQAGPDAPVRACFVPSLPLVENVRPQLDEGELARIRLVDLAAGGSGETSPYSLATKSAPVHLDSYPGLPGFGLLVEPGEMLRQKAAATRFDALIAAVLIGLFVLGAAALTLHTWREARDASRKITFVTQVSHELRTPLTSIRMFADLLGADEMSEEKRRKFAGTIAAESARLSGLIEHLLAFNALEQGTRRLKVAPFEASALVREVIEETTGKLEEAGLRSELRLPALAAMAAGDRSIVKQALLNLLDNACKYAAEGGVVEISVTPASDRIVIRVADRGAGIPASIRDRLFDPFVQGGQTLTAKSPGVGLGLSLARGLLRQADADLVSVPASVGATFEIRLPVAPQP